MKLQFRTLCMSIVICLLIFGCSQSGGIEDVKLGISYDDVI